MKKILLTLTVGICCVGIAGAQDPTKAAKKKSAKVALASPAADATAKAKAKEARARAIESGQSATFSKESTVAPKAN